jgi:hypothetical protein
MLFFLRNACEAFLWQRAMYQAAEEISHGLARCLQRFADLFNGSRSRCCYLDRSAWLQLAPPPTTTSSSTRKLSVTYN